MKRITNPKINILKGNEIFVFGSNTAGRHGAGAALTAVKKFGAVYGVGVGMQGNTYAIATLDKNLRKVPIPYIHDQVKVFKKTVTNHPELVFYVTAIGTGLAGFTAEEIAPMFREFLDIENVYLPVEFLDILIN